MVSKLTYSDINCINPIELVDMDGGNAHLVIGYYFPTDENMFSFPVYAKYCMVSHAITPFRLSLSHEGRRYSWVIRDGDGKVIARMKFPNMSRPSLCLPEDIPPSLSWELLSTGILRLFKRKVPAHFVSLASSNQVVDKEKMMIKLADDAPEEFIDPISFLIMEDPVKVPTSRYIFDRNTLATHLAKDPSDPFSREPLTIDLVRTDVELRAKIDNWLLTQGVSF